MATYFDCIKSWLKSQTFSERIQVSFTFFCTVFFCHQKDFSFRQGKNVCDKAMISRTFHSFPSFFICEQSVCASKIEKKEGNNWILCKMKKYQIKMILVFAFGEKKRSEGSFIFTYFIWSPEGEWREERKILSLSLSLLYFLFYTRRKNGKKKGFFLSFDFMITEIKVLLIRTWDQGEKEGKICRKKEGEEMYRKSKGTRTRRRGRE